MLSKDRFKTTSGFFVIPLFSQLWEEKNYCERRKEISSLRPVALQNRHKHLFLFKLGYDVHALLSSVMYILSGKKITAVYPMSRRRWDQNTLQVANRLNRARATNGRLLHVPPCIWYTGGGGGGGVYTRYLERWWHVPGGWVGPLRRSQSTQSCNRCFLAYIQWWG